MNCILYCTAGVLVDEADYCFSSLMFTTGAAALTALLLLSGGALTLLCARLRRARGKEEQAEHAVHTVHTAAHSLRYSTPALTEHIHKYCFISFPGKLTTYL